MFEKKLNQNFDNFFLYILHSFEVNKSNLIALAQVLMRKKYIKNFYKLYF